MTATTVADWSSHDTVLIGYPNWRNTIAPLSTFLTENELQDKTVMPFCTHGGGGIAKIAKDIAKLCPKSTVRGGLDVYGDGGTSAKDKVDDFLKQIGIQ